MIMNVFSDNHRALKVTLLLITLLSLCTYSYFIGKEKDRRLGSLIDNSMPYAGKIVPFSYAQVIGVEKNTFTVKYVRQKVKVFPLPQGLALSSKISFLGELQPDGRFRILEYHIHKGHKLKIYLSVIAMFIVFTLFLRRFRFNPRRFLFEERSR